MKKITRYIVLLFFFCFFPYFVQAATALKASSQNPVVGSYIYIELNIDYGETEKISEAHYLISYDNYSFALENVIWTQSPGTYHKVEGNIYIDKPNNGSAWEYGGQVQLKLKVLKSGVTKVNVRDNGVAKYLDGSVVSQTFSGITISATEPSTDTTIGTLYIEGQAISPTFSRNTYEYTLKVPPEVASVNVVARKGNEKQTITGDGIRTLEYGANRVRVIVMAESGSTRTYEIMITREDNRTGDTSLKKLSVSNTDITYNEKYDTYTAIVSRSVESVLITATTNDPNASLLGTGTKKLEIGNNTFTLKVNSHNGLEKTYTINIVRSEEELQVEENSTELMSLKVNNNNIDLKKDKFIYIYGLFNEEDIEISCVPKSKTATFSIEKENIKNGLNKISILVTEKDESTSTYSLLVYKPNSASKIVTDLGSIDSSRTIEYASLEQEKHVITKEILTKIDKNKTTLLYNVVDENLGVLYQVRIPAQIAEEELDATIEKENSFPLTLKTKLPSTIEIMYFVGDIYEDGTLLKIYSYKELGNYTNITEGVEVINGYITFTTNGEEHIVLSATNLVKENKSYLFIGIGLLVGCSIVFLLVIIRKKNPKIKINKKDEPQY